MIIEILSLLMFFLCAALTIISIYWSKIENDKGLKLLLIFVCVFAWFCFILFISDLMLIKSLYINMID